MKTIQFFLLSLVLLFLSAQDSSLYAQSSGLPGLGTSSANFTNLMREALKNHFFVVRIDYVLENKKTGKRYGANDKEYFSRMYSFGIAVEGKLLVDSTTYSPWFFDSDFAGYENDSIYRPALSRIAFRPIGSSQYRTVDVSELTETDYDGGKLKGINLEETDFSLPVQPMSTNYEGLNAFIQIPAKCDLTVNDTCKLDLNISHWGNIKPNKSNQLELSKPPISQTGASLKLLGAAAIEFSVKPGEIKFYTTGIIRKFKNQSWIVSPILANSESVTPKGETGPKQLKETNHEKKNEATPTKQLNTTENSKSNSKNNKSNVRDKKRN